MIKNSLYSLTSKVVITILNLVLIAILGRILDPKDFGIFAIVLSVQSLFQPFLDMGLTPAYIHINNPTKSLKNSFYTVNIVLGLVNALILLILAPVLEFVYKNELLKSLIMVFSLSVILNCISTQNRAQLLREKKFNIILIVTVTSNFITFVISIIIAYKNFGVWTLVIKAIVLNLMLAIIFYFADENKYSLVKFSVVKRFSKEFKFGFELFVNRMLNGILNAADKFLFGKIYGSELLGHYNNSQQISRMVDLNVRTPITTAVYSYLARYSDENKKGFYDKLAGITFLITLMISGLLIIEGDILVKILLGNKWDFASDYIQPLGLFGMGMVLKGIFTVISMSENSIAFQNKLVLGSLLLSLLIMIIIGSIPVSAKYFVYIISVSFFLYWLIFIICELFKYGEFNNDKVFLKVVFFSTFMIIFSFVIKFFIVNKISELIIVSSIFLASMSIFLFSLYNKIRRV